MQAMRMTQMITESNSLNYHWPDRTISILINEYAEIDFDNKERAEEMTNYYTCYSVLTISISVKSACLERQVLKLLDAEE